MKSVENSFFADFNLYMMMAHYVGKVLHIRPNDIMDGWGVAELLVAYGTYVNEEFRRNYKDWLNTDKTIRKNIPEPPMLDVPFISNEQTHMNYEKE